MIKLMGLIYKWIILSVILQLIILLYLDNFFSVDGKVEFVATNISLPWKDKKIVNSIENSNNLLFVNIDNNYSNSFLVGFRRIYHTLLHFIKNDIQYFFWKKKDFMPERDFEVFF